MKNLIQNKFGTQKKLKKKSKEIPLNVQHVRMFSVKLCVYM